MTNIHKIIPIALEAGKILMHYRGQVTAQYKPDGSPYTTADLESDALIVKELGLTTPEMGIVSEESKKERNLVQLSYPDKWFVDGLDGTRNYIEGHDAFGILIGSNKDGAPDEGLAYYPANNLLYYTDGTQAWKQVLGHEPQLIQVEQDFSGGLVVAVAWRQKNLPQNFSGLPYTVVKGTGGEKLCRIAAGEAHFNIAPRHPYSHWDMAAPHAILKAAGGVFVVHATGAPVTYDQQNFELPPAIGGHPDVLRHFNLHPQQANLESNLIISGPT